MSTATKQPGLFDIRNAGDGRVNIRPHYADLGDEPRLAGQNGRLLARLRRGPADTVELATDIKRYGTKYTSRISDVRAWLENNTGETIVCERGKGGVNTYKIERKEK